MNSLILSNSELPSAFRYPDSFLKVIDMNLVDLKPWHIIDAENARLRLKGLRTRYPNRVLIPFAERYDNDDVACFTTEDESIVHVIHDFASSGYEERSQYNDFWLWFRAAIEEMIMFD